jgi:anti-anti-sigma factor
MDIEHKKTVSGWVLLMVSGRIDAHTAPQFDAACQTHLGQKVSKLAIDLTGVNYLSSAGLRVLLAALKTIKKSEGKMALLGPRDNVREVLDISGFTSLFLVVDSLDELS